MLCQPAAHFHEVGAGSRIRGDNVAIMWRCEGENGGKNTSRQNRMTSFSLLSMHLASFKLFIHNNIRSLFSRRRPMTMMMFRSLLSRTRAISQFSSSSRCAPSATCTASAFGGAATFRSGIIISSSSQHHHPNPPPQLQQQSRTIHIEKKLADLQIALPAAPMPKANYNIVCRVPGENIMYVSGHLPIGVSTAKKHNMLNYCYILMFCSNITVLHTQNHSYRWMEN